MQPHVLSGPGNTKEALQPQGASPAPIIRELQLVEWAVGPAGGRKSLPGQLWWTQDSQVEVAAFQ